MLDFQISFLVLYTMSDNENVRNEKRAASDSDSDDDMLGRATF
jgi:hypothetical protein